MTAGKRRYLIIHNPVSGARNSNKLKKILKMMTRSGLEYILAGTEYPGHASSIAREASQEEDPDLVIVAAGGDGTISEVAAGLGEEAAPIGIIPLGTANVLARELGIGTSLKKAFLVLKEGLCMPVHPGRAGDKRFLLMVGAGYDSLAVSELNSNEKKRYGALAYIFAATRAVRRFSSLNVSAKVDGETYSGASVIVSRARLYGGPFTIAPDADLADQAFHVLVLKHKGFWAALKYGLALATNRIWKLSSVDYVRTTSEVTITSAIDMPCQYDGDGGLVAPLTLSVDRQKLQILGP
ncbi:MAG: diacylglycerol kinase family lipid kinase [Sneathiellales bacterium]|nr:diacylglycerol kinase family lipid kinase [Sneathiellales bacterium]